MGFIDAKNSSKLVMFESRHYRFDERWMATVNALDLPENSPFKDPEQMPLPEFPPHPPL